MESHGHLILVTSKWRVRHFEHPFILNCRAIIVLNQQHKKTAFSRSWIALEVWSENFVPSKSTGMAFLAEMKQRFQPNFLGSGASGSRLLKRITAHYLENGNSLSFISCSSVNSAKANAKIGYFGLPVQPGLGPHKDALCCERQNQWLDVLAVSITQP